MSGTFTSGSDVARVNTLLTQHSFTLADANGVFSLEQAVRKGYCMVVTCDRPWARRPPRRGPVDPGRTP